MIFRYISNIYPLHGHFCNYGAFPQTWEDPFKQDPWTGQFFYFSQLIFIPLFSEQFFCAGLSGDKDPLDVCEIGFSPLSTGSVVQVSHLPIRFCGSGQPSTNQGVPWFRSAIYQSGFRDSG
jgi:inorganic pyrophosphatase